MISIFNAINFSSISAKVNEFEEFDEATTNETTSNEATTNETTTDKATTNETTTDETTTNETNWTDEDWKNRLKWCQRYVDKNCFDESLRKLFTRCFDQHLLHKNEQFFQSRHNHLQNRKRLIKRILTVEIDDIIFALSSSVDILIFQSRDYRRRSSSAAFQCRCSRRQSSNNNWTSLLSTTVE